MASKSKFLGELLDANGDVNNDNLDNVTVDATAVSDSNNTSTGYFDLPNGTTAQRPTAASGMIRFNSTLNLAEYYDGTQWKSIDSPPTVSSADVSDFDTEGDTITLTGTNFQSGMTVLLKGDDGTEYNATSVTVTNVTTASFDITASMLTDNDPFDIVVTNPSGLSGTLANALDYAPTPAFTVASGSLGSFFDTTRTGISISTGATSADADDTITYALGDGDSLPSGLSLNSSTGAITGDADAVGSDTTTTFDIVATATSAEDSGTATNSRSYSITIKAPVVQEFTSVGSATFSVPAGVSSVDVLVVAAGGGGAKAHGGTSSGGAGAGGLIFRPQFPVTPGGSVSYSIGDGLRPPTYNVPGPSYNGDNGQNSTFGSLTAIGGAGGSADVSISGGSGGGGGGGGSLPNPGGQAQQPNAPGDSGTYGFGSPGGECGSAQYGAGGGGAGGPGTPTSSQGSPGGIGKQYDISGSQIYYAGGGGGNSTPSGTGIHGQGGQGGGGGGSFEGTAQSGEDNRGGGGGSCSQVGTGSKGGSGVVIVKY